MIYFAGHYLQRRTSGLARYAHQLYEVASRVGARPIFIPPFLAKFSIVRKISLVIFELIAPSLLLLFDRKAHYISPSFSVPVVNSSRVTVVIHDLAFFDFPDCYSRVDILYYRLNLSLLRFLRKISVVVPSEFVRDELNSRLRIDRSRISVIPPYSHLECESGSAVSERPSSPDERNPGGSFVFLRDYVLVVSNGHPRKNLASTIRGFEKSKLPERGFSLLLVGNFEHLPITLNKKGIHVFNSVSDKELSSLYREAYAVALFSLNEGFGIPVVEAASFGVPCVHSNVTGLKSFDLDNKLPTDVVDEDDIAAHLNTLLLSDCRDYYLALGGRIGEQFNKQVFSERWSRILETDST